MDMRDYLISFPMFGDGQIKPPAYISIFGFNVYLYGLLIAIGFGLAALYCFRRAKEFGLKSDQIIDMLIFALPSAVICARIYYCVFNWEYYSKEPLRIFAIRDGGLAMYGVLIGAVAAMMIYCKVKKIPAGALMDLSAFGLLIGQAVGRWGNFFNREVFGTATNLPWRMGLINPINGAASYVHPLFFYEMLWNALGLLLLHLYSKKRKRKFDGQFILMYVIWYGFGRAMLEFIRDDMDVLRLGSIAISQLTAILSALAAAVLLYLNLRRHKKIATLWADSPKNPLNVKVVGEVKKSDKEEQQDA